MKHTIYSFIAMSAALVLALSCGKEPEAVRNTDPELITIIPVAGMSGCTAIISGNNFSTVPEENVVTLGGVQADVVKATAERLTITTPVHEDGMVDVKVVVGGHELGGLSFTYVTMEDLDIMVNSVVPSQGYAGETISINGENFSDDPADLKVTFDGVDVPIVSSSGMTITVVAPEHGKGVAKIIVYSRSKTAEGEFEYVELGITGCAPALGTVGTKVTVRGEGFSPVAEENVVRLGGVECEVVSATVNSLQVLIPEMPMGTYTFSVDTRGRHAEGGSFVYPEIWTVETVAGVPLASNKRSNVDGTGANARFWWPQNIVADADGLLWITQRGGTNRDAIRTMDPSTYEVKTVVPTSNTDISNSHPWGSCFDREGTLWFVGKAQGKLFKLAKGSDTPVLVTLPSHTLTTNPMSVLVDDEGRIYLLNRGNTSYISIFDKDLNKLHDYAVSFQAQTMIWNSDKSRILVGATASPFGIHVFNPADGTISRIAGNGSAPAAATYSDGSDGQPLTAVVGRVEGMALDSSGAIWFNDYTACTVRKLIPGNGGDYTKGTVKTVAGTPMTKGDSDGMGQATFTGLCGIIPMKDGSVLVSTEQGTIRRIFSNQ